MAVVKRIGSGFSSFLFLFTSWLAACYPLLPYEHRPSWITTCAWNGYTNLQAYSCTSVSRRSTHTHVETDQRSLAAIQVRQARTIERCSFPRTLEHHRLCPNGSGVCTWRAGTTVLQVTALVCLGMQPRSSAAPKDVATAIGRLLAGWDIGSCGVPL